MKLNHRSIALILICSISMLGQSNPTKPEINESLYHLVRQCGARKNMVLFAASSQAVPQPFSHALAATAGIEDAEAMAFMSTASELNARFVALDDQAKTIIERARESVSKGGLLPPMPSELGSLQVQKDLLKSSLEGSLKSSLRPETYSKIAALAVVGTNRAQKQEGVSK